MLVYVGTLMPMLIAFHDHLATVSTPFLVLFYLVDVLFCLDIFITSVSAYYDTNQKLIVNNSQILHHYFTGWFTIDFISSFPIYLIQHSTLHNKYFRILKLQKMYKLLRLSKLVRLLMIWKYKHKMQKVMRGRESRIEKILQTCLLLLLCCHVLGCLWFIFCSVEGGNEGWQQAYNLNSQSVVNQYVGAFYFILQTLVTTGYGDLYPLSPYQKLLSCFFILFGVFIYAFLISDISNNFQYKTQHQI